MAVTYFEKPVGTEIATLDGKVSGIGAGTKLVDKAIQFGTSYSTTNESFTITKTSIVKIYQVYNAGQPLAIGCKVTNTDAGSSEMLALGIDGEPTSGLGATGLLTPGTYYIWGKRKATSTTGNTCIVWVYPITA